MNGLEYWYYEWLLRRASGGAEGDEPSQAIGLTW